MFCPIIATIIKFFRTFCNPKEGISMKNFWIIGLLVLVVASWNLSCSQKENDDKKVTICDSTTLKTDAAEREVATKILENMELVGDRYVFTLTRDEAAEIGIPSELYDEVLDNVDRANAMVKEMRSVPNSHVHLMTPQESLKSQSDDEQSVPLSLPQ